MKKRKPPRKVSNIRYDSNHIRLQKGETQRENGSYQYRFVGRDGKRHCFYAPTLQQLREKREKVERDNSEGIKLETKKLTVNELYELWADMKRGIKQNTFLNYLYMYRTFVQPNFGRMKVINVKKMDVRNFYNSLYDSGTMKISTLETIQNVLHQVFQLAVDDNIIRHNPCDNMLRELKQVYGDDTNKRDALTAEQQKLFLDYLLNHKTERHWYPVFYILVNTGMRAGEITGLRWCDVDMKKGLISINHTLVYYDHNDGKGAYYSINTPKTKAGIRTIPMTEGVKKAFQMERDYQTLRDIENTSHIDGYRDFVFVNRWGRVQHPANLNKAIKRIVRKCNAEIMDNHVGDDEPVLLPYFTCHHLRHTFATRMIEAGVNIKFCQDVLGHADISTTLNIYVSVTSEMKEKEIQVFGNYIETGAKASVVS